jgi:hypothetical protein
LAFRSVSVLTMIGAACGNPKSSSRDRIALDSITIHAMSIRVAAACYRSPHSVLFGPPTPSGQQGKAPGWFGLQLPMHADSGWAELRDPDSKSFSAFWRRDATDSVVLRAGDDFLRIEMRLAVTDSSITGSAVARSDATVERDASGRLSDLRRQWMLRADRAPCDSMLFPRSAHRPPPDEELYLTGARKLLG